MIIIRVQHIIGLPNRFNKTFFCRCQWKPIRLKTLTNHRKQTWKSDASAGHQPPRIEFIGN